MLDIDDMMQTIDGKGVINILAADKIIASPRIYSVFLLWLLSELFERLPEVGDLPKPKIAFFFDEAHLLFNNAPTVLLEKIEQLVRLIRSKGVGIYFVSQNPLDIPDKILAQLGNRVQHALRAFTPRDQKAVKVAAETMRKNPNINAVTAITELGVGEALVSLLDEKGTPTILERVFILPPSSQIGTLTTDERQTLIKSSLVYGQYEETIDRESAYERLRGKGEKAANATQNKETSEESSGFSGIFGELFKRIMGGGKKRRRSSRQGVGEALVKSVVRTVGTEVGRQLIRGLLGSLKR